MAINKVIDRNNNVLIDLTNDTVSPNKVLLGTKFHGADGKEYTGQVSANELNSVKYTFIDYDGTILYQFTDDEIDALTSLPAGPDHTDDNLTFQEWNWTLEELKNVDRERVERPIVGANLITTDGKTHIILEINESVRSYNAYFYTTDGKLATGVIEWGDGTSSNISTSSQYANSISHTYDTNGTYEVVITANTDNLCYGYQGRMDQYINYCYKEMKVGNLAGFAGFTTVGSNKIFPLKKINIPKNIKTLYDYSFEYICMPTFIFPRNIETMPSGLFNASYIDTISLPGCITKYSYMTLYYLKNIYFPSGIEVSGATGDGLFGVCHKDFIEIKASKINNLYLGGQKDSTVRGLKLHNVANFSGMGGFDLLESLEFVNPTFTKLPALNYLSNLERLVIPDSVTSLSGGFNYCIKLVLDLSQQTKVLTSSSGFNFSKYSNRILVPMALLDQYKSASYWSNYASIMVGV